MYLVISCLSTIPKVSDILIVRTIKIYLDKISSFFIQKLSYKDLTEYTIQNNVNLNNYTKKLLDDI